VAGPEEIRRMLDDTVAAFRQAAPDDADAARVAEARGEGSAADGQVKVVVKPGGRLESVTIDPRAMRLGSEAIGGHIVTATNAALDDLAGKVAAAAPAAVDTAQLMERLREIQVASVERLETFMRGISEAGGR
jgi:DNA-binding protein YbaB